MRPSTILHDVQVSGRRQGDIERGLEGRGVAATVALVPLCVVKLRVSSCPSPHPVIQSA